MMVLASFKPTRSSAHTAARRAGFTLVAWMVVSIILATVAGLVIPRVLGRGRSTDMAASATTQ